MYISDNAQGILTMEVFMKHFKTLLLAGLILLSATGLSALETDTTVYFQGGTMTPDNFKFSYFWAIAGFNLNWKIGNLFMLTPECFFVVQDLKFNRIQFAPAVIANLTFGNFFVGAGPTKWYKIGSESITSDMMLKVNVGLTKDRMIYTLYAIIDTKNDDYNSLIGIKLGFNL